MRTRGLNHFYMPVSLLQQYTKTAKSPADLISHLQGKGLQVTDPAAAQRAIETTGYYRLLIYMRVMQDPGTKQFRAGASFEDILKLYEFDRQLRLLCLDAIERIEVALRAAIIDEVAVPHGPHFYLKPSHFGNVEAYRSFFSKVVQTKYLAIEHYHRRYNDPPSPPIWAICEAITFGTLSHLYSGLNLANRKAAAKSFRFDETVLVSWFKTLNDLRNTCAHHNRLWDKSMLVNQPTRARAVSSELATIAQQRFYSRAVVLVSLLNNLHPGHQWKAQLIALIGQHPTIPLTNMGFPADWLTRSFWV
jgi:abortive infection bacteriophage resistance protein